MYTSREGIIHQAHNASQYNKKQSNRSSSCCTYPRPDKTPTKTLRVFVHIGPLLLPADIQHYCCCCRVLRLLLLLLYTWYELANYTTYLLCMNVQKEIRYRIYVQSSNFGRGGGRVEGVHPCRLLLLFKMVLVGLTSFVMFARSCSPSTELAPL